MLRSISAFLLALTVLALFLLPATATAQEGETGGIEEGEPGSLPPEYQVYGDGTLVIGGDVVVQCRELPRSSGLPSTVPAADRAATERSHAEAVRACSQAGFPPAWDLVGRISNLPDEGKLLIMIVAGAVTSSFVGCLLVLRLLVSR